MIEYWILITKLFYSLDRTLTPCAHVPLKRKRIALDPSLCGEIFYCTFPSGTLSFSGEIIATMSFVFVSTTLLAEDAGSEIMKQFVYPSIAVQLILHSGFYW